ncbi:MAG: BrnT family toxin [Nitrospinae bacterium]|nr:BrnT family toxin [Nitrospinota bacterium]
MRIVWDPVKAALNEKKHGVKFSMAATVLDDPMALTIEDQRHSEQRFVSLGSDMTGGLIVVVFSITGDDEIRLISARKATHKERRDYEKGL